MAPGNVTATAVDSTIISVKWEGLTPCRLVNGHIVENKVQYKAQSGGVMGSKDVSGNWSSRGETDLTGLTPSTNYSIAVAAVNEQETVGLYSDPIVIETLPLATFPGPVETELERGSYAINSYANFQLMCSDSSDEGEQELQTDIIIGVSLAVFGAMMATCGIFTACVLCARSD